MEKMAFCGRVDRASSLLPFAVRAPISFVFTFALTYPNNFFLSNFGFQAGLT